MSKALFVSDIHIRSTEDDKCLLFIRLLDEVKRGKFTHLFLLGDIFDLWIADRKYFTEHYSPIISKIRDLTDAGIEVHYFEGNHDLDLEAYWRDRLGVITHTGPEYFNLDGIVVRAEHGDQMDPDDRGYRFLRWFLRTPVLRWLGRHLPDRLVGWIGTRASLVSRDYTSHIKTIEADQSIQKTRRHALEAYAEKKFDLFISGHTHTAEDSQQEGFRCLNLGTWLNSSGRLLQLNQGHAVMMSVEQFWQQPLASDT